MSETRRGAGVARAIVRRLGGGAGPMRLRLAVGRQRPLPHQRPQAAVRRRPAGGPHALQAREPDGVPGPGRQARSVLL